MPCCATAVLPVRAAAMSESRTKKRFIAGAVCPKCGQMDKIVAWQDEGRDYRACVSCGFTDELRFRAQPRELDTRVNTSEAERQAEVQVIKLPPRDE